VWVESRDLESFCLVGVVFACFIRESIRPPLAILVKTCTA